MKLSRSLLLAFLLLLGHVSGTREDGDRLLAILASPRQTLNLYNTFKQSRVLSFSPAEEALRFRIFKQNAQFVAKLNKKDEEATFAVNFFSTMTDQEQNSWMGFNSSGHTRNPLPARTAPPTPPTNKLWTNEGAVTEVRNQGSCGSCYTFSAVGALETRYHRISGVLRRFAEQEYLDCTYQGRRGGGCGGGWMNDCYDYSMGQGGRLAAAKDYPYTARSKNCLGSGKPDAMISARLTEHEDVLGSEDSFIAALAEGAVAVAIQASSRFRAYSSGVFSQHCNNHANHAVTAVGYTPDYILLKNSWGGEWGDRGFVRVSRGGGYSCHMYDYASFPVLSETGVEDGEEADTATEYVSPEPAPVCKDVYRTQECQRRRKKERCVEEKTAEMCALTCGGCVA